MIIGMHLGPSKPWWAYLALLSNPHLRALLCGHPEQRAIFFDDPSRIESLRLDRKQTCFFYILWDGIVDPPALHRAAAVADGSRGLKLLTVGDQLRIPSDRYEVQDLFAQGPLTFSTEGLHFDPRTHVTLTLSRVRNLLMPAKNMRQTGLGPGWQLLTESPKIVFCGSYGIGREFLRQLCERHAVDTAHFRDLPFHDSALETLTQSYRDYLQQAGTLLARLLQAGIIDAQFLFSAAHVLGREYFLRRMYAAAFPLFTNGSARGVNINVYTTPFYRQHVFPDFGSSVGTGNYPRLADLLYFRKQTIQLELIPGMDELAGAAAEGNLELYFDRRWAVYAPRLKSALEIKRQA